MEADGVGDSGTGEVVALELGDDRVVGVNPHACGSTRATTSAARPIRCGARAGTRSGGLLDERLERCATLITGTPHIGRRGSVRVVGRSRPA
jgi:hypothetical protein